MLNRSIGVLLGGLLLGHPAMAATCANYPYTFSNGTTADANQVNADFTSILNCANTNLAPLASPSFTGNVGIGTATPASKIEVSDPTIPTTGNFNSVARFDGSAHTIALDPEGFQVIGFNSSYKNGTGRINIASVASYTGSIGLSPYGGGMYFGLSSTSIASGATATEGAVMVLSPSGNVGIGTVTPATRLAVQQSIDPPLGNDGTSNARVYNAAGTSFLQMQVNASGVELSSSGTTILPLYLNVARAATPPITILASGNVGIGTITPGYTLQVNGSAAGNAAWVNLSDARMKKNILEITDAMSLVKRLRGVRFEWKKANERSVGKTLALPENVPQIGLIAQEVEAVVPEAVVAPKKGSNGLYRLKESDLIPVLIEAMKEQQAEIEQLRANLAALKSAK